ncbi:MAG: murein biosynthesis integral membrane protein MurJ, partial [Kiloniellales bacterium]
MAFARSIATVGGYTGISRILGFVRDILIAGLVGTGPVADAFFVAFRLPNLFRRLFAEGAFNAAFVPLFARRLEQEGAPAARLFAEQTLSVLLTSLLIFTAAAMAGMPWLMYILAPGFAVDPEKFDLAVQLSRITFPCLLFMALVALLSGLLNSLYRFSAAAAAPILLNLFFIAALLVIVPSSDRPGHVLAWTVAAAGVGQFLFLMVAASRAGMALRLPRPRLTEGVRRLLRLMGPGILSAGALQINIMVGTIIASLQAGAVSYLYYADRVYQLPLGLIGIAFGVVLLPDLSRKLRSGADQAAMHSLNRGLELALLLTLPATLALVAIPWPIIVVLFERGAFDRAASDATAWALAAYAVGLPAYVLVKILQPAFYAREDTVTPLKVAVASV